MAIKAKKLVVGGKLFSQEPDPVKEPVKPPQEKVKTTAPVKRPEPERIEYSSPQEMVEILDEPKLASTKNGFILKSSSKFHRDMIEE